MKQIIRKILLGVLLLQVENFNCFGMDDYWEQKADFWTSLTNTVSSWFEGIDVKDASKKQQLENLKHDSLTDEAYKTNFLFSSLPNEILNQIYPPLNPKSTFLESMFDFANTYSGLLLLCKESNRFAKERLDVIFKRFENKILPIQFNIPWDTIMAEDGIKAVIYCLYELRNRQLNDVVKFKGIGDSDFTKLSPHFKYIKTLNIKTNRPLILCSLANYLKNTHNPMVINLIICFDLDSYPFGESSILDDLKYLATESRLNTYFIQRFDDYKLKTEMMKGPNVNRMHEIKPPTLKRVIHIPSVFLI